MEVKYNLKREEVWNWYWNSWWTGGLKWIHLQILIIVAITCIYVDYKSEALSLITGLKIGLIFFSFFIFMAAWPQLMYKPQLRTLIANQDGIHTKIAKYDKMIGWEKVDCIENSGDYIKILGKNKNAMLIPKRAFASDEEMQEYFVCISNIFNSVKNA